MASQQRQFAHTVTTRSPLQLENALPHFSALETAMTTSRAIVRRSFAIKDVGRQEFLWCFRRALSVNQPNR